MIFMISISVSLATFLYNLPVFFVFVNFFVSSTFFRGQLNFYGTETGNLKVSRDN